MTSLPLSTLLPDVPGVLAVSGDSSVAVSGISNDTRRLQTGDVFVAIPGLRLDGATLAAQAVKQGASAVVAESEIAADLGVPVVRVSSARQALADFAAAFYGHPSRTMAVVGITGTDGKTSTSYLLSAILQAHGLRTGWLTTVSTKIGPQIRENAADHTTPEAPLVQATLAEMAAGGVEVAIVETSSHALELERVRGVAYHVGVFTNLSPEHINFHGSFDAYRLAKAKLFERLPEDGLAVLNADDPSSVAMVTEAPVLTFGFGERADFRASDVTLGADGTRFTLHSELSKPVELETRLVGRFNVLNWLAAFAAATYFGCELIDLMHALESQQPVPGRMNLVQRGQPFPVVVDFAHTPQALEKALDTVRELVPGRVFLVFGLAGGRDFNNRPVMGDLAARKADHFVITSDDPHEEDPAEIAKQVATGVPAGASFAIETDRRLAIRQVLAQAGPGDAVLLAGMGHQEYMAVGDQKVPWNDARVAAEEIETLGT